jgi:Carboxypeptidase regulatory-like domain
MAPLLVAAVRPPALLAPPPVAAPLRDEIAAKETSAAALSGTVTDAAGAAIPGATITVTNPVAQITLTTTTGPDGRYRIANLPDGAYNIKAQSPGFETHTATAGPIAASHPNTADFVLQVGAATQTVTVEADSLQLERESKPASKTAPEPKPTAPPQPAPVFQITTDNGDRWTSTDGLIWTHE